MRLSLRARLALLSLSVLLIPYFGYSYLRDTERHLRQSLADSLAGAARDLALVVAAHEQELPPADPAGESGGSLYVHSLRHAVQVDGFKDDWEEYLEWADRYGPDGLLEPGEGGAEPGFRLLLGRRGNQVFGLISVDDDALVYPPRVHPAAGAGDRVTLVTRGASGRVRQFHFASAGPGPLTAYQRELDDAHMVVSRSLTDISGQWQPRPGGYVLELVLPLDRLRERLGIVVEDLDSRGGPVATAATAGAGTHRRPGLVLLPNPELESLLARMVQEPGRRIWLLDPAARVLASAGVLAREPAAEPGGAFWRFILPPVSEQFADDLAGASRLRGPEVQAALAGEPELRWRSSPDGKAVIVSAAAPVRAGGRIAGVVVVEETSSGIQSLQREATVALFTRAVGAFGIVTLILLAFATWLSLRLRRLSRATRGAIDGHGRVIGELPATGAQDEIGELSRDFNRLLRRLRGYNEYLEGMAGRLAHELRTPMAVVQSSLENLDAARLEPAQREYLGRAEAGVERLQGLVVRLSEASRLEQALASAETEAADLDVLVRECVDAYTGAYPDQAFRYVGPGRPVPARVAPELIVQLLDKLVDNAREFAREGTAVTVAVEPAAGAATLAVTNLGPGLPEALGDSVFNSMVSMRAARDRRRPHLGLGLYLVRLIAEFHGGRVAARNLPAGEGVRFEVRLPAA